MKKISRVLSFSIAAVLCIFMAACSMKTADVSEDIKHANTIFSQAVEKGDTNMLREMYAEDAKIFPANSSIIDGISSIGNFWAGTLKMGINKVNFETQSATRFGDLAIEEGNYELYVGDNQMVDHGKYIVTWKYDGGKWKVFRDIWNSNDPLPQARAMANDTVMIVMNDIKPGKVAQFEEFNKNYLLPAGTEFNSQIKNTVRIHKPAGPNKDGSYTYTYFMDPCKGVGSYDILNTLIMKYGKEKAQEYMKIYADCLQDGKVKTLVSVETGW